MSHIVIVAESGAQPSVIRCNECKYEFPFHVLLPAPFPTVAVVMTGMKLEHRFCKTCEDCRASKGLCFDCRDKDKED